MYAIFICKGEPISHCCLLLSDGEVYNYTWIKYIGGAAKALSRVVSRKKIQTVFSRGWDMDRLRLDGGLDVFAGVEFRHVKDYYAEKTKSGERPDRFTMCRSLGLEEPSSNSRNALDTARVYQRIIVKLNSLN